MVSIIVRNIYDFNKNLSKIHNNIMMYGLVLTS